MDVVPYSKNPGKGKNDVTDVDEAKLLRMSLSSTASAGLMDIGDLSNVWNRKDNTEDMDANIAKEVEAKYAMGRFMVFLDENLEDEFIQKFFYSAIKTHRLFTKIVAGLIYAFMALYILRKAHPGVPITYAIMATASLCVFFMTKAKNFHHYHMVAILSIVFFEMTGLAVVRYFTDFDEDEPFMLTISDARYLNVVYLTGQYTVFMAMRIPFKYSFKLAIAIDLVFFVVIGFFPGIGIIDYVENFIFLAIGSVPMAITSYYSERGNRYQEIRRAGILRHTEEVAKEKIITEKLLLNILPNKIARRLMDGEEVISDGYSQVTVLFADLVGWTEISRSMNPTEAVSLLSEIVGTFDRLTHMYKIEKIKTIGDGYLVGCGLPESMSAVSSANKVACFALDMIRAVEGLSMLKRRTIQLTLGIHTGPVVAGVIGKTKFLYDLWGDSVNTASRMQSHGEPGKIHVTSQVQELLQNHFEFLKLEPMQVKGKGIMQTYYLLGKKVGVKSMSTSENVNTLADGEQGAQVAPVSEAKEGNAQDDDGSNKLSGAERKKRKAREAMKKRSDELDIILESKIKLVKRFILSFTDPNLEKQYREKQNRESSERMIKVTLIYIGIILGTGPNILQFDSSYGAISTYYIAMGCCAGFQIVLMGMTKLYPYMGHMMNIFSVIALHVTTIALFTYYRMDLSLVCRFIYQILQLFQITTYMSSRIPYRYAVLINGGTFFFIALLSRMLLRQPLDTVSLMFYLTLVIYGMATSMQVEKHDRRAFLLSFLADEERSKVIRQREESERLLFNILPESVIEKMRAGNGQLIDTYDNATILFADIVGFTVLSSKLDAKSIVTMLNSLFSDFDTLAEQKGLEKIKTIGDAYMVVCGLPYPRTDHAKVTVEMGLGMAKIVQALPEIQGLRVNIRIGIHSGGAVGGIVGLSKMVFDIWGENVNVASKMESNGTPGCINVSHVTRELVGDEPSLVFEDRQKSYTYGGKTYNMFYAKERDSTQPPASVPVAPHKEAGEW